MASLVRKVSSGYSPTVDVAPAHPHTQCQAGVVCCMTHKCTDTPTSRQTDRVTGRHSIGGGCTADCPEGHIAECTLAQGDGSTRVHAPFTG